MEIKILADKCERRLPSGATQTYPIGWAGEVAEETALRWIGEGKAEAIGGEAALSPAQLEFLKSFAEHAMASMAAIAAQQADQADAGGELQGEPVDAGGELQPAEGDVAQVLAGDDEIDEAAVTIAGLPPEIPLEVEVAGEAAATSAAAPPVKSKRR